MTEKKNVVVVGVDGSDAAHGAFAHGAWEAHRRGCLLHLQRLGAGLACGARQGERAVEVSRMG